MRALLCIAFILIPIAHSAGPPEVTIRSGAWSPPSATISAQSNLVESAATVYDPRGNPVAGLRVGDFLMSDNGKPQPITVFSELRNASASRSSDTAGNPTAASLARPRNIALLFDDLHLTSAALVKTREAAAKLISSGLPPGERIGIFTASGAVTVDLTNDPTPLLAALPRIKTHEDPGNRGMTVCPVLTPYTAYVISEDLDPDVKRAAVIEAMNCDHIKYEEAVGVVEDLAHSVWENSRHRSTNVLDVIGVLVSHLAKQEGDRILVLVSEGFIDDSRMMNRKRIVMDAALRSHVVVNALSVGGVGFSFPRLILSNVMTEASSATGGRFITNTNDLTGGLSTLASAPEASYLLGFQADHPDAKYHTLKVGLTAPKGFRVESRPGYFAAPPPRQTPTTQQRIDRAVLSRDQMADVPAVVHLNPAVKSDGRYTVKVTIDIDAKTLRFATQAGLRLQQLTFVTAIDDDRGNFVEGKQAVMDLHLKPSTLAGMQTTGIHAVESFLLPRGRYTVREVVRELVQDRLAASDTPLNLP